MLSSAIKQNQNRIPRLFSFQLKNIHFTDNKVDMHVKNDFLKDPTPENFDKFKKDQFPTHWINDYLPKFGKFITTGDALKVFDTEKDSELGRFKWNSNGCYPNRLSNILYRSKA
jgi:hypothetical protein